MKGSSIERCAGGGAVSLSWMFGHNVDSKAGCAARGADHWARIGPWIFYISLWISSLVAVFLSRGWLALFMSGQALSACKWLLRNLAKKTAPALSPSTESSEPFAGAFDEL
jgi:hypothetical protein